MGSVAKVSRTRLKIIWDRLKMQEQTKKKVSGLAKTYDLNGRFLGWSWKVAYLPCNLETKTGWEFFSKNTHFVIPKKRRYVR